MKKNDGRSDRQKVIFEKNTSALVEAAIELLNSNLDSKSLNLSMIAKRAGVTPATAYTHFPDGFTDVYSAIVREKVDLDQVLTKQSFEALSPIEKLRLVPVVFAQSLIDLGNAGKIIFSNMSELINKNKWPIPNPVPILENIIENIEEFAPLKSLLAKRIVTMFRGLLFEYSLSGNQLSETYYSNNAEDILMKSAESLVDEMLAWAKTLH